MFCNLRAMGGVVSCLSSLIGTLISLLPVAPELIIFDCDGVLVDSDRISLRVQAEWITTLGLKMTYEDCVREFLGLGMPDTLRILVERLGRPLPASWEADLSSAVSEAFYSELRPVAGVVEALEKIVQPTCIASSGTHQKMRMTLGITELWSHFEGRIYSGEEVRRGKPAPDLFLHAAASMGVAPERCVVVEDSPFGVTAAGVAGMPVLGYAPVHLIGWRTGVPRLSGRCKNFPT
jgi:HAD superfamily hydrolase (TIGR01509 family)